MYMVHRIIKIRVDEIHPDMQAQWILAALVKEIQLEFKVVISSRTEVVKLVGVRC